MRSTKIRVGITPSFERNINPLWRQALVRFCWPSTDSRVQNSTAHTPQRLQLSLKHSLPPQLCCHSPGILLCWRSWIRASLQSYRALHPPPLCDRGVPLHDATSENITFAMAPSVWHCWFFTSHTQPPQFFCPYVFPPSQLFKPVSEPDVMMSTKEFGMEIHPMGLLILMLSWGNGFTDWRVYKWLQFIFT